MAFGDITSILNPAGIIRGELTTLLNLATKRLLGETVAIVDSATLIPVFYGAQPMRVRVRESSRVMQHPLETGVVIADHIVNEPIEIEVDLIIPAVFYISVYQQIKTARLNGSLLVVQTNADVYTNMIVSDMPHDETPEMTGVLVMPLRMRQCLFVAPASITTQNTSNPSTVPSNYAPAAASDSNTVLRGQCTPTNPTGGVAAPSLPIKKGFEFNGWAGGGA